MLVCCCFRSPEQQHCGCSACERFAMAAKFRSLIAARGRFVMASALGFDPAAMPTVRNVTASMTIHKTGNNTHPLCIRLPASALAITDRDAASRFVQTFETDHLLPSISVDDEVLRKGASALCFKFNLPKSKFVHSTLELALRHRTRGWRRNGLFPEEPELNVIVEFSSPNVAKPFHVGHLRSTILGHFCAIINAAAGHKVTKLNWLGDWGTQFGLLLAGLEQNKEDLTSLLQSDDATKKLLTVYVEANKKASEDEQFALRARELFQKLEDASDADLRRSWSLIRQHAVAELKLVYTRLGIEFDAYHGESMYSNEHVSNLLLRLEGKGLLETSEDGRKVVRLQPKRTVTVQKSDGSSLYLSRDCAAALDRSNTFEFDRMLYVVDNAQSDHFSNLFSIFKLLDGTKKLSHVRFGRVQGMSSRRGSVVFLKDILDEAKERVAEQRRRSPNTRANIDDDHINDVLGITAVLVNDMKRSRLKDYEFNWDKALQSTGDSGVKLQYSHCRLASLLRAGQRELGVGVDQLVDQLSGHADLGQALGDEDALNVIYRVARFDEAVRDAYVHLEPCHLVQFLFQLCNEISRALVTLPVLKSGADPSVAAARLALFAAARATLAEGMKLLGLVPLDEM